MAIVVEEVSLPVNLRSHENCLRPAWPGSLLLFRRLTRDWRIWQFLTSVSPPAQKIKHHSVNLSRTLKGHYSRSKATFANWQWVSVHHMHINPFFNLWTENKVLNNLPKHCLASHKTEMTTRVERRELNCILQAEQRFWWFRFLRRGYIKSVWTHKTTRETFGIRLDVVILMAKAAFAASQTATNDIAGYVLAPSLRMSPGHHICLLPAQVPHLLIKNTQPPWRLPNLLLHLSVIWIDNGEILHALHHSHYSLPPSVPKLTWLRFTSSTKQKSRAGS